MWCLNYTICSFGFRRLFKTYEAFHNIEMNLTIEIVLFRTYRESGIDLVLLLTILML